MTLSPTSPSHSHSHDTYSSLFLPRPILRLRHLVLIIAVLASQVLKLTCRLVGRHTVLTRTQITHVLLAFTLLLLLVLLAFPPFFFLVSDEQTYKL